MGPPNDSEVAISVGSVWLLVDITLANYGRYITSSTYRKFILIYIYIMMMVDMVDIT